VRGLGGRGKLIAPVLVASALAIGIFWNVRPVELPRSTALSEAESKRILEELKDASFTYYVLRDGATIRESPSTSARVLRKEIKGAEVHVVPRTGPWEQVRDGNIEGWMRADELGPDRP
jgi:hypothetical protein